MDIELIDGKAVIVQHGEQVWLLGCPAGIGMALKEAGVMPTAVLLTRVGAPGLSELEGKPLVVRASPLRIGGLEAHPVSRTHGWDYTVKSEDGALLWTERGDVSGADVHGYDLAIIGNKHRSESFGENVISRPWPTASWCIREKTIKHEGDKWVIYSADGSKKLGEYDTEEEAKDRLHEIEFFKHQKKDDDEAKPSEPPAKDEEEQAEKVAKPREKELPDWLPDGALDTPFTFKEENGRWRWYAHTTNDMLDLQKEVIPPEAIDWSLAIATVLNDRGPLLFRHMPIRLGACDKQVRVGPMLFESGLLDLFDQNPAAQAVKELVAREPGRWRMSPGLRFRAEDLVNGRYHKMWIAERSITHVPANSSTAFAVVQEKEMQVTDEMLQEAAQQLGLPFEQIKALAQKYLDAQKEIDSVDGLLKALKEGVEGAYQPKPPERSPAEPQPVISPDWGQIIQANTAALRSMADALKELAAGKLIDAKVQGAIEDYLAQSPQFGSQSKGEGDGDEAQVRKALEEAEKAIANKARPVSQMAALEALFTSTKLNS